MSGSTGRIARPVGARSQSTASSRLRRRRRRTRMGSAARRPAGAGGQGLHRDDVGGGLGQGPARGGRLAGRGGGCAQGQGACAAGRQDRQGRRAAAGHACFRDLVPAVWIPSLSERALKEQLKRRAHLIRLRSSAKNRSFGLLSQWGLRLSLARLREPDAMELLESHGVPEVWRRSVCEAVALVDHLDRRLAPLERELLPLARADQRVQLLESIPGWPRSWGSPSRSRSARSPASLRAQAGRLLGADPERPPVGEELAHRPALQGRLGHPALGGGRGRPARLARVQPLAPPLPRRQAAQRQDQRRQVGGRPQGPDRRLARSLPKRALQACRPGGTVPASSPQPLAA